MKIFQIILFTILSSCCFSQDEVETLKQEVDSLFEQNESLAALAIMEKLVNRTDTIPGYARYKTRIGLIYDSLDSISIARKWYINVMHDSLIDDSVEDYWLGEWD